MRNRVILIIYMVLVCTGFCCSESLYPSRIVSLGPNLTEELYLLDSGDRVIADTTYCKRPPDAAKKKKIGSIMDINIEEVVSVKPDLVLATSLINPQKIRNMQLVGLKVEVFNQPKTYAQICEGFLELADLIGKSDKAKEIISQTDKKVGFIKSKSQNMPRQKIFVQLGANPLFTVTGDSFINDYIEFAGGINIAKSSKSGLYSREEVLKNNPDIIIIVLMGIEAQREKKRWQSYAALNAVKNNGIVIMDAYRICSPTPQSFAEALEEIYNAVKVR